MASGAQPVAH
ncbi:hypothetical protein LINPERHAP1_LOCUS33369 [Linum perenne]